MTISERKTVVGVPVETVTIPQNNMQPVTAYDRYGQFGQTKRVAGVVQVMSPDVLRFRNLNRFSKDHYYTQKAINKLKIEKRPQGKNPLVKEKIIWSKTI